MKSFKFYIRSAYNEFLNLFRKQKYSIIEFDVDTDVHAFLIKEAKCQGISFNELVVNILKAHTNI